MSTALETRPLKFKERMKGHVGFDHLTDLEEATVDGTGWVEMSLEFRMFVDDVERFWNGDHVGHLVGDIYCKELGGQCRVRDGHFQLMIPVDGDPRHQHMLYHARFTNPAGREFTLNGYKEVIRGEFNPLDDTTSMLTRIFEGWTDDSQKWSPHAIATGVLRISVVDIVTQFFTYRSDKAGPLRAVATTGLFVWNFNRHLWAVYGFGRRDRAVQEA